MRKAIQRRIYSFVSSPSGGAVLAVGSILLAISALQLAQQLLQVVTPLIYTHCGSEPGMKRHCSASNYIDNLRGRSFEDRLCLPVYDVVYTWVNGSDPKLLADIESFKSIKGMGDESGIASSSSMSTLNELSGESQEAVHNRFRDNEELRYSLRSVWQFAPWVRRVFIVTNGQVPVWLDTSHPRVKIVQHKEIFPNTSHLPVFSSPAIEVHLHRIPGLSDKFLYFNDDTFLGNHIWPDDFYSPNEGYKIYLSWDVPNCAVGCPDSWLNDRYCDPACNVSACNFDEGDCLHQQRNASHSEWIHGTVQDEQPTNSTSTNQTVTDANNVQRKGSNIASSEGDSAIRYCSAGCPTSWLGDKVCDRQCNNRRCAFDAGDCGMEKLKKGLLGTRLRLNQTVIQVSRHERAMYIELVEAFPHRIDSARHDNPDSIRSAVLIQRESILIVLFSPFHGPYTPETESTIRMARIYISSVNSSTNGSATEHSYTFELLRSSATRDYQTVSSDPIEDPRISGDLFLSKEEMERHTIVDTLQQRATTERKLLTWSDSASNFIAWTKDVVHAMENVAVDGVPADGSLLLMQTSKHSVRVITGDDWSTVYRGRMLPKHWQFATKIVEQKKNHLLQLAQADLENLVRTWIQRIESSGRMAWPWSMFDPEQKAHASLHQRKLLDEFGESLRFVANLYNAYFSVQSRKVPAHMPHMMDKRILEELQDAFSEQFDQTSSHRFRSSTDMQYAFSYAYYLMEKRLPFNVSEVYTADLDVDGDTFLSEPEIKAFTSQHRQFSFVDFVNELINCSVAMSEKHGDNVDPLAGVAVNLETVKNCPTILANLEKMAENRREFKHRKMTLDQVTFYMLGDNASVVRSRLDEILVERKKFVCLNDDMTKPDPKVFVYMQEFFDAYYPDPSPFELPANNLNQMLYADELSAHLFSRRIVSTFIVLALAALVGAASILVLERYYPRLLRPTNAGSVNVTDSHQNRSETDSKEN